MKSIITLAALAMVAMTSCKKDWRCVCNSKNNTTGMTTPALNTYTYEETTKKIAKDRCEAENKEYQSGSWSITETCSLD